tara:strand:- start:217 stop:1215 length:999 start_codon:yes stop_codon:yes gene_type:complete
VISQGLETSELASVYWKFAALRHGIYLARLAGKSSKLAGDPIIEKYKFTNAFRAADRTSQYLIREVIYGACKDLQPEDQLLNILLFKMFNRSETWESLVAAEGVPTMQTDPRSLVAVLRKNVRAGKKLYSAAYIMPPPKMSPELSKFERHIYLLFREARSGLLSRLCASDTLQALYENLRMVPSLGPFLAFQYAVDIAYSEVVSASESDFVVAGPGAIRGVNKCFTNRRGLTTEQVIFHMYENQEEYFRQQEICFEGLGGRPLQPVDCQNLFCEVDKYARVAYPELNGSSGRARIKQKYQPHPLQVTGWFPPKWGINESLLGQLSRMRTASN